MIGGAADECALQSTAVDCAHNHHAGLHGARKLGQYEYRISHPKVHITRLDATAGAEASEALANSSDILSLLREGDGNCDRRKSCISHKAHDGRVDMRAVHS